MKIGKIITHLIALINLVLVVAMLAVAYSERLHPEEHHMLSLAGLAFPIFVGINGLFLLFWLLIGRFRFLLLPLLGFAFCYPQLSATFPLHLFRGEVPEPHLKLLSYNIESFASHVKGEDGNPILNYLRDSQADIICLQEYSVSGSKKLLRQKDVDDELGDYPYHHINRAHSLACYSKYPILSATPLKDKDKGSNGSMAYEIEVDGDTLLVINCHLQSNRLNDDDKAAYADIIDDPDRDKVEEGLHHFTQKLGEASALRAPQAETVAKAVAESPHATVVVMGDFNAPPVSYPHYVITRQLHDAYARSGKGLGISYHQNRFYFRIDHILISPNLKSHHCQVDNTIGASDHYPISCFVTKKQ